MSRVAPATDGPSVRAWASPRSVRGASIRPSSRPSALPVDSPWRTRISMEGEDGTRAGTVAQWTRMRSHWAQVANSSGGRRRIRSTSTEEGSGGSRRTGRPPAGPPPPRPAGPAGLVALGQVVGQARGALGPERLLGRDGDADLRLGRRRWPPRGGRPRRPARSMRLLVLGQPDVERLLLLEQGQLLLLELGLAVSQLVDLRGPWPGGPWRRRPRRTASSARSRGVGRRRRRSAPPAARWRPARSSTWACDLGDRPRPARPAAAPPRPGRPARAGSRSGAAADRGRCRAPGPSSACRTARPSASPLPSVRHRRATGSRSAYGPTRGPRPGRRRPGRTASSQLNQATSWLSPGAGAGSSSGAHSR